MFDSEEFDFEKEAGKTYADAKKYLSDAREKIGLKDKPLLGTYSSTYGGRRRRFSEDYNVDSLCYPNDLFGNQYEYGDNYVIFYINVAEESRLLSDKDKDGNAIAATVDVSTDERLRAGINQVGLTQASAIIGSTIMGSVGGKILDKLSGGQAPGAFAGGAISGVSAGIVSAAADGKMSRQQKRLKSAIALHTPNTLTVRYSASYDVNDTLMFQAGAAISDGGIEALKSLATNSPTAAPLAQPVAGIATNLALNAPGIGSALSAASGLAPNPKKEQVFTGVNFREFTFDYQFAPRNEEELRNVMNIINMFKYHMHPEFKDQGSYVFVYPSEFDISYFNGAEENKYLHRHTSCVLKDMSINYTPNGSFTAFGDGAPTQINVQLTFGELAILTKDQIQMGY